MRQAQIAAILTLLMLGYTYGQTRPHHLDPMKRALLEPVMALHHAEEIGLSAAQRAFIENQVREASTQFKIREEKLAVETQKMAEMLERGTASEKEALDQMDRVLSIEREIKRINLVSAIRVILQLTPEQRHTLMGLEVPPPPPPPPPPHAPAPPPPGKPRAH
jgi:hypothetical protein